MLAFIGGTGLNQLAGFSVDRVAEIMTPYQDTAVRVACGALAESGGAGGQVFFLPRHGEGHTVPPHRINYRANLYALRELGVASVIAVNAVGGIHAAMRPGVIAVPDQIIDYTSGREHTFFDGGVTGIASPDQLSASVTHIDFTYPYDENVRRLLISSAAKLGIPLVSQGVYGATQGPRLETPAEVRRLKRDGCDMVGMTGMPEASLARELGMAYGCIALSVNWAAGLSDDVITIEGIRTVLKDGMGDIHRILSGAARSFADR
jgi:5'-methylthioinosine phosphorylase